VLDALAALAPVTAVRGNNDAGAWAHAVPEMQIVRVAGVRIQVIHDLGELARYTRDRDVGVVISGHSHRPKIQQRGGVLFLNPGSAGPRRFKLPVSVAEIVIDESGSVAARVHELAVVGAGRSRRR
jgi:putative phosphoesterase